MKPVERIAVALAERFPNINPALLSSAPAFAQALDQALAVADEAAVIEQIVALGGLAGARNPYGVIVARVRRLPRDTANLRRLTERSGDGD